MSNRNFNASVITQRRANKAVAMNILSNMKSGNPYSFNAQTSNTYTSIINQVNLGNSLNVSRGPTCTTIDPGCPCSNNINIPFEPSNCGSSYTLSVFNNTTANTITGQFNKLIEVNNDIIGIINTPYKSIQTPAPIGVSLNLYNPITINSTPSSLLTVSSNTSLGYAIIVSYKKDGTLNWITKIDTPDTNISNLAVTLSDISFDATGIYVTGIVGLIIGSLAGTQTLNLYNAVTTNLTTTTPDSTLTMNNKNQNTFVVKYTFNGNIVWALKMITTVGSNTSPKIFATNGLLYFSSYIQSTSTLDIYNSLNSIETSLTGGVGGRYMAICAFAQSGNLLWVDKLTFSGVFGVFNNVSLVYENNLLYICFNTFNQIMNIYSTNTSNNIADPTIIVNNFNFNNMSPLPNTNGIKTILLVLNTPNGNIGITTLNNMYVLKSNLTTNLSNNLTTTVMKISDKYIIMGGWFIDTVTSLTSITETSSPISSINGAIQILNKSDLTELNLYKPYGSDSRVYDLFIDNDTIIATGLSNGSTTFPSDTEPDIVFNAAGGNDVIIYSYNINTENLNWITNWQSSTFENALCILKSGNCIYTGGYIDSTTNFYTPDLSTRQAKTIPDLTYTVTARSPNLSIFTI